MHQFSAHTVDHSSTTDDQTSDSNLAVSDSEKSYADITRILMAQPDQPPPGRTSHTEPYVDIPSEVEEEMPESFATHQPPPAQAHTSSPSQKSSNGPRFTFDDLPSHVQEPQLNQSLESLLLVLRFLRDPSAVFEAARRDYLNVKCCSLNAKDLDFHYKRMSLLFYKLNGFNEPTLKHVFLASLPDELQPDIQRQLTASNLSLDNISLDKIFQLAKTCLDKLCEQKQFFKELLKDKEPFRSACKKPYLQTKCKQKKDCDCNEPNDETVFALQNSSDDSDSDQSQIIFHQQLLSLDTTIPIPSIKLQILPSKFQRLIPAIGLIDTGAQRSFDILHQIKHLQIRPNGIRVKSMFKPFTDILKFYNLSETPQPYQDISNKLLSFCPESHSEFTHPNPLWKNKSFFIQLPFKLNEDINPTKATHPRMSPSDLLLTQQECSQLLAQGLIEPTNSQWACQAFYVEKHSEIIRGKKRLVIDYQPLNMFLQDDKFPLPCRQSIHGIMLSAKKSTIATDNIEFLGMIIKNGHYQPGTHIAQELLHFPDQHFSKRQVQQFLSIINYIRDFIPHVDHYTHHLSALLKKKSPEWNIDHTNAVTTLKQIAQNPPPLKLITDGKRILQTDASDDSWGAILLEEINGKEHFIAYASGQFSDTQKHYHSVFKEILAEFARKALFRFFMKAYLVTEPFPFSSFHPENLFLTGLTLDPSRETTEDVLWYLWCLTVLYATKLVLPITPTLEHLLDLDKATSLTWTLLEWFSPIQWWRKKLQQLSEIYNLERMPASEAQMFTSVFIIHRPYFQHPDTKLFWTQDQFPQPSMNEPGSSSQPPKADTATKPSKVDKATQTSPRPGYRRDCPYPPCRGPHCKHPKLSKTFFPKSNCDNPYETESSSEDEYMNLRSP
ncbi:hypothetical protein KPL71_008160 [Citrus sinensis]|uniref:Uncharacterized protein n=1 Tax=Citrus sinensis TaxID=2711 RepID=A0ACB8M4W3_CITSI|nr:hypothetical protein KPL71_008160 [Citrus sinensis]